MRMSSAANDFLTPATLRSTREFYYVGGWIEELGAARLRRAAPSRSCFFVFGLTRADALVRPKRPFSRGHSMFLLARRLTVSSAPFGAWSALRFATAEPSRSYLFAVLVRSLRLAPKTAFIPEASDRLERRAGGNDGRRSLIRPFLRMKPKPQDNYICFGLTRADALARPKQLFLPEPVFMRKTA